MRRTVASSVRFGGIGLHGGVAATAAVRPCRLGRGIRFRRVDLPVGTGDIAAHHSNIIDTQLCTRLGNAQGATLGTVEHLMAALAGLGITDALIEVDGPEIPIMDGSARPFVAGLLAAGFDGAVGAPRALRILETVEVVDGDRRAALRPAPAFSASYEIEFPEPAIGRQTLALELTGDAVITELADCRTFCRAGEVVQLRAMGLAKGGSLENAIVVEGGAVLNAGGLRRADEFVRHKMLDAVGDLALAGAPVIGHYEGVKAGHEMTAQLLRALFDRPETWEWVRPAIGEVPHASGRARLEAPLRAAAG
ncbi:MAG: UDP-3-O-acyl-N-acetylglucosamine deacetylase [Pikeienuella sp.]